MSSKKTNLFSNNSNVLKNETIDNEDIIKANSSNKFTKIQKSVNNVIRASKIFIKNNNHLAPELEGLNTFEKIIKLQLNLKIIDSTKQQFE